MKRQALIIALTLIVSNIFAQKSDTLSIEKALRDNLVSVEITGREKTSDWVGCSHFGPCIQFTVVNLKDYPVAFKVETGRKLAPKDTNVQTMMVTKREYVKLKAKEKKDVDLYAMCTELNNAGPNTMIKFDVSKIADQNLKGLATLIERLGFQDVTGQEAVWVLTNNQELASVAGTGDLAKLKVLLAYLETVTGKSVAETFNSGEDEDYIKTLTDELYPESYYSYVIKGSFDYTLQKSAEVHVFLCDEYGLIIHELLPKENEEQGQHHYDYDLTSNRLKPSQPFYIELQVDDKVLQKSSLIF